MRARRLPRSPCPPGWQEESRMGVMLSPGAAAWQSGKGRRPHALPAPPPKKFKGTSLTPSRKKKPPSPPTPSPLHSSLRSLQERGWVPDDLDTGSSAAGPRRSASSSASSPTAAADASFRRAMRGMRVVAMEELSDAAIEAARARRLRERCVWVGGEEEARGGGGRTAATRWSLGGEGGAASPAPAPRPSPLRRAGREERERGAGACLGQRRFFFPSPPLVFPTSPFFAARPPPSTTGRPPPWTSRTTILSPPGPP